MKADKAFYRLSLVFHGSEAELVMAFQLWGDLDALIQLDDGGYAVMDIKTTANTDWIVKNYALQVSDIRP